LPTTCKRAASGEIVRADNYAESGSWQVLPGGVRVGWIRRTWQDTESSAVWQARDAQHGWIRCTGKGGTARELLVSLCSARCAPASRPARTIGRWRGSPALGGGDLGAGPASSSVTGGARSVPS